MAKTNKSVISNYMTEIGKTGGANGRGQKKARTSEQARKAALIGWEKRRKIELTS